MFAARNSAGRKIASRPRAVLFAKAALDEHENRG